MKRISFIITLLIIVRATSEQKCLKDITVDISSGIFDPARKIYMHGGIEYNKYYKESEKVLGCICEVKTCINICCPLGQFIINESTCHDHDRKFKLDIYDKNELIKNDSDYYAVVREGKCIGDGILLDPNEDSLDAFYIQKDGRLYFTDLQKYFEINDYCLSYFYDSAELSALICVSPEVSEMPIVFSCGIIISIPFLVATLLIYALIPEKTNINTRCQMCYVFSLICAYCILVSIQLTGNLEGALCTTLGLLCHYSFMTSFCWMNISCVDIFRTFSGQRGFGFSNRSSQMRRFFFYCLYTYGLPLVMVAIILGLNAYEHEGAWFHPNFGIGQCWLRRGYPLMLYFYGPMGILLLANIILFLLTALKIRQINKDTAMLRSDESKKHYESNKQRFNIYIKLIIVMGINWTLEFISWLVDWLMGDNKIPELWYVTDMCNALYGVFIFYLFVCKRKIWIMMKKRYYIFMGKPQKARALSSNANHFQFSQTNTEYLSSSSKM